METKRQHLQSALSYVQQGKLDRAIAEYEAILRADPSDCNVLNALGDLCARTGSKADAIGYFMRLAEAYRLDGLYVRAVAVYKKMLKLDPLNGEASLACGELYAEQGLVAEAKLQFQGLADHSLGRGDMAGAVEMYEKMIRMDPGHRPTLHKLAGILVRPGGVEEALSNLNGLGERLVEAGQAEDAGQIFEKAVELLRSQGREADAARFARGLDALGPTAARREDGTAAVSPGEGVDLEAAGMLTEQTPPLQIFPESLLEEEGVPALEVPETIGERLELDLEDVASLHDKGPSLEEGAEVDISIGAEAESLEGMQPAPIELDPSGGSEELVPVAGEPSESGGQVRPQTLEEELQEANFFMQQGMLQEARAIFERILLQDPEHRLAKQHLAEIEGGTPTPTSEESPRPDVKKPSVFRVTDTKAPQGEFVDLAGDLSKDLGPAESSSSGDLEPEVEDLLHQLDQGIRDQVDVADYETHYNLGLAYRDLELYEKAIEEFRLAANDAANRARCASLIGLCYLAKGDPERSVEEFLKGLAVAKGGTEERWALLYDLATAYEAFGDVRKALETLTTIHSEAPKFRDVRVRIRDVGARIGKSRGSSR
ncbi:MAG: tetratricopeptide repeat protein [Candidatus Methylomirabilales bacterium]